MATTNTRADTPPASRSASTKSRGSRSRQEPREDDENTPLLAVEAQPIGADEEGSNLDQRDTSRRQSVVASLRGSLRSFGGSKSRRKYSSIVALLGLCVAVILIMVLGFMTPEVMKEYAQQAVVFEPESLSIPDFTSTGVIARIQGSFKMDGSRVRRESTRRLGRFGTWVAQEVKTSEAEVEVHLPGYGDVVVGKAKVPPIKVKIWDGAVTPIDVPVQLNLGSPDGIRQLADDFLQGRLGKVSVRGEAELSLQSGIIRIPKTTISKTIFIDDSQVPKIPQYDLSKLNVHEVQDPDGSRGLSVDVSASVANDWPFEFEIPKLSFAISVGNCRPSEPTIMVADAHTGRINIHPKQTVHINATGYVSDLPKELMQACPDTNKSPLDILLGDYIHGEETTIYVSGSKTPSPGTPKWIADLMADITLPLPLEGRQLGNLIRNFSLTDVQFSLPDPFAEPDSAEAQPQISAIIDAVVNLPEEMNFPVDISRVRADADVYYRGKKLGRLDLRKWQPANSTRLEGDAKNKPGLAVQSTVDKAPLWIENQKLFSEIVQKLLFGSSKPIILTIKADVDVEVKTALGKLVAQGIPAEGVVPVKPISKGGEHKPGSGPDIEKLGITFGNLSILNSTADSLALGVYINLTNPTQYSATVPYLDINLLVNNTILGHGRVTNVSIKPGKNTDIPIEAIWAPVTASGAKGRAVGRELLSQYLSGFNTTLTVQAHKGSIPSQPALGEALSHLNFTFPTPRLHTPKPDPDDPSQPGEDDGNEDEGGHFILGATMHLVTSTALFTLASPLKHSTIFLTRLNATAFYKADRVGHILHEIPFAVPPGISETPRLPVEWSLSSVGYEAVRGALGGKLKLGAKAEVGVKIGNWKETVWFEGGGIGAKIRL